MRGLDALSRAISWVAQHACPQWSARLPAASCSMADRSITTGGITPTLRLVRARSVAMRVPSPSSARGRRAQADQAAAGRNARCRARTGFSAYPRSPPRGIHEMAVTEDSTRIASSLSTRRLSIGCHSSSRPSQHPSGTGWESNPRMTLTAIAGFKTRIRSIIGASRSVRASLSEWMPTVITLFSSARTP
jgi:hypothetical protein